MNATRKSLKSFFVGVCPACSKPVAADEPDGPVWTCPADLSPTNPYRETPCEAITPELQEKAGVFSNCAEDFNFKDLGGHWSCYERIPLHSACYEKGSY
jgi:hypothetical protein